MRKLRSCWFIISAIVFFSQINISYAQEKTLKIKSLDIPYSDKQVSIDGNIDEPIWDKALTISLAQKVVIVLALSEASSNPAHNTSSQADATSEHDEIPSVIDLEDATDESSNSIERITKAFPGATVVKK